MSEHITHTAVMDDGARLALHSPEICGAFKTALSRRLDIARFAAMTRSGDSFTVKLLHGVRERWENRRGGDLTVEKLAFVLGWRCHLAADRTFKPVYRILQPEHYAQPEEESGGPSDVSVYHDVTVFREVYAGGRAEPFVPASLDYRLESHPAARAFPAARLERLAQAWWQGALLGTHSLPSGEARPGRRPAPFLDSFQPITVDVNRYARAFHSPDPDLIRRYIVEPNFYNPADPVIALARSIQQGAPRKDIEVRSAVAAAVGQSQYAQALERAYRYLLAASDYFERRIDERELAVRCDVGKPHVPAGLTPRRQ